MTVYVVLLEYDYDTAYIKAVVDSVDKAVEIVEGAVKHNCCGDRWAVEEWLVSSTTGRRRMIYEHGEWSKWSNE
jgi:hypothetical protein